MGKAVAKVSELRPEREKKRGHLDIHLFGHLEVALDGAPYALATPRKSLQVLAYLLLHREAPVSREYLAFLLYPDDEEGAARAKLRATLSELSKILPSPADRYVSVDGDKVVWKSASDVWLDVESFEAAANDRTRVGEAIELYRGDLLPEVYDEWLDTIRERYRNTYLRCLNERVSAARSDANLGVAIEAARKILAIDPWREDVVRRIIAMRYEAGDRAGALSEYAGFAKRLGSEMNAEPMPETAAVAERVRRGEALAADSPDERVAIAGGASVLPFVGRRDEMDRLLDTWSRVGRGRGACAFIGGEAGIGKSRIALEFAHAVEDRGGRVLVGTTSFPETVPYESVVEALRSALPLVASLKPSVALASVATLVPELHARLALPSIARLDATSERIRLFDSLFRCIADLAAARPLLLVLEDMHWAQGASVELLQFLLRRIAVVRVMILVTYRDEETPRMHALHRLRREARTVAGEQSIWLSRLSAGDVEELRARLGELRDRPAEALVEASHGNPLFLTQLLAEVREGDGAAAPASLRAAVARRIERLSERARAAAEIASCIGDRFSRDAVREVSAWDDGALSDALDELLDRRIIREAGGRGFLEYTFTHQLMQDAIAQSMPREHAAIRRRRVARVLEELYPERFGELSATLASHYEFAGDVANATRCYLEAVRRSISIGALEEARIQCDRALALDGNPGMRAHFLLERMALQSRRGDRESRRAALLELESVDKELRDPDIHRATLLQRIEFALTTGDRASHERAVAALRASVAEDDAHWSAAADLAEGKLAFTIGEMSQAHTCGEAALGHSRTAGDEAGVAQALCFLAQVDGHRGRLAVAEAQYEEAGQVAARAGDLVLELLALSSSWTIAYQRRDMDRCRFVSARCLELATKLGDRPAEAQAHGRVGIAFSGEGGDTAQARRHFATATQIYEESGGVSGAAAQLMNQAVFETRLGFFDRGLSATTKAIDLFERASDGRGRIGALANLVFLRAWTGELEGAREIGELALRLAREYGLEMLEASVTENMAFLEAASGNYARALELANESIALRRESGAQAWSSLTLAGAAMWHVKLGEVASARALVTELLSDDRAILRGTDWPSYCYWSAAQILHWDKRDREARAALQRARRFMQANADTLEGEDRERFLSLPWHVELQKAASENVWPNLMQ